ncbi:MAG: MFS transporter [Leptolyngbya sp. SIOISBB]|nr:MFS transporter [Leptolyngbya sp. SIOISBB]
MRTFLIIWLGQFASLLGSQMTGFAISIWAWEVTGQATPFALLTVVAQVPRLMIAPFAGVWVDQFNRKYLMMLGDMMAGLSTIIILTLVLSDQLQVWHLYLTGAVNGLFGYVQSLAYSASVSLLVPERHYTRAAAFESALGAGSFIVAPAAAGVMYAATGLNGILTIDLVTFAIAIATLSLVTIPRPLPTEVDIQKTVAADTAVQRLTFGARYLWRHPGLRALIGFFVINNFISAICFTNLFPMVLSRSGNSATILGTLSSFFGVGGLLGGLLLSVWGGPKRRIHGVFMGNALWKVSLLALALAQRTAAFLGAALVAGFISPLPGSCGSAIWRSQVAPDVQGRVFAARYLITQLSTALGTAIAGPLADRVFEPAMQPGMPLNLALGDRFGSGGGAGMAVQVALFASLGIATTLGGYGIPQLRQIEGKERRST